MNLKKTKLSLVISMLMLSSMNPLMAQTEKASEKSTETNVAFSNIEFKTYTTTDKPNIILVSLDDLGYGQMNFDKRSFDPKTMENRKTVETYTISIAKAIEAAKKSTPTLNKLMSEGVKLTNGYVAHGVSGPSRAAIMTGRSPARYGVYSNIDAEEGISLSETFLPELFQNHGYYTAAIGKWHMSKISSIKAPKNGRSRDYHDNYIQFSSEETQPQNRGFDYFMGFHNHGAAYYNSPALFKNREQIKAVGYISDQFTTESIGVVNRAKMLEQPFLLYLAFNAPHLPNDAPAPIQYQSKFNTGSPTADNFYASIYAADQGLNRILEQMKKNGQYDNTMILFTSDNGAVIDGPLPLNGAQKGYKGQTTTGGTHTPMFIWYGGRLHQGSDYNKLVSAMDLFPTALDVAGIAVPNNLDGVSLLPYLQGDKKGNPHQNLYWMTSYPHHFDEGNIAFWNGYHKFIRYESDDYPFNPNTEALSEFSWTIRNNDFMLMYLEESGEYGMYKLNDLRQEHNLIKMNPKTFVQMKEDMKKFIASTKKPNNPITLPKYERIKRSSLK